MNFVNSMKLSFISKSTNESFARSAVAAFLLPLDPTVAEIADVKTAVSEAVTNAIVHAYPDTFGTVYIEARLTDSGRAIIKIRDKGVGIADIEQAMEPLYTTSTDERAGLGFAVMQSFMDKVTVRSAVGKGTTVTLEKNIIRAAYGSR
ncbi:anti-sigma F factor [uncultured Ruminococcus sp.]|uniref:anti-sigma F factor n=1 Tax=uncultured Ruminococcus sp. TaxID=165186 RepID=UPI00292CD79B|nr:anti-sigma F factor [uncultured Ruminococcus sp.]